MIYQSSSIRALLVLACAFVLATKAAPRHGQLVQLHAISRAQYEALLGQRRIVAKPVADQARHINYTIPNPLNGWSNDISHGWHYLLNKTGLYQKPDKPNVPDRGYKLCYVNPIYGGPNAGEGMVGRATRAAEAEERVAINDENDDDDDAFDANGKPIAVNYFPNPGVTCVWVRPTPEPNETELEVGEDVGEEAGVAPAAQFYPASGAAGAYPYAGYPSADPYAGAYSAYPYGASPYASPYGSPYATPYAYGRSDAKSNKRTAPIAAIVERQPEHAVNALDKSKQLQPKTQPKQQSRQYGAYGYGSPYGGSYGSPYGGYYGGLYGGAYGGGYGNAYGSPYGGLNPYAGVYGGQPFGYPAYGHYDNEDSGEDTDDSEDSGEGEDDTYENDHGSEYGGEEEDDE